MISKYSLTWISYWAVRIFCVNFKIKDKNIKIRSKHKTMGHFNPHGLNIIKKSKVWHFTSLATQRLRLPIGPVKATVFCFFLIKTERSKLTTTKVAIFETWKISILRWERTSNEKQCKEIMNFSWDACISITRGSP